MLVIHMGLFFFFFSFFNLYVINYYMGLYRNKTEGRGGTRGREDPQRDSCWIMTLLLRIEFGRERKET